MTIKNSILNMFILAGYIFSICGGLFGILIGALLLLSKQPEAQKHSRLILGSSIATLLLYITFAFQQINLMSNEIFMYILISSFIVSAILGGFLAQKKGDFFIRGFFLSLFTGVWGLIILVFSPDSKARESKHGDTHFWPKDSWIALVLLSSDITGFIAAGKLIG